MPLDPRERRRILRMYKEWERWPGSLKWWFVTHAREIVDRYGEPPYTKRGTYRLSVLRKLSKDVGFLKKLSGPKWRIVKSKIDTALERRLGRKRR